MEVPINYLAVLAAGVSNMILGYLWYGPLFGKQWIAWSGMNQQSLDAAKTKGVAKSYILMFVGALVMAYVLSHVIVFGSAYTQTTGISAGVSSAVWSWLGFIAPVTLGSVLWDNKPWKLWILNNAYNLVALVLMGIILSLWL
ncbi:MAG: hypothetical protein UY65_C0007G0026 [Parcubacteria group bacterium GW2011_GWA2_51_12]|nr:MAG: hypothetical protein UY65_C0007G0026 [Parcubacteria group bacterium GW2011_GWA2_51_12]